MTTILHISNGSVSLTGWGWLLAYVLAPTSAVSVWLRDKR